MSANEKGTYIFRDWISRIRELSPKDFKDVLLRVYDYRTDGIETPAAPGDKNAIIAGLLIDEARRMDDAAESHRDRANRYIRRKRAEGSCEAPGTGADEAGAPDDACDTDDAAGEAGVDTDETRVDVNSTPVDVKSMPVDVNSTPVDVKSTPFDGIEPEPEQEQEQEPEQEPEPEPEQKKKPEDAKGTDARADARAGARAGTREASPGTYREPDDPQAARGAASAPSDGEVCQSDRTGERAFCLRIMRAYDELCPSLRPSGVLTDKRRRAIRACLPLTREPDFSDVFRRVEASDFLCGRSRDWQADFDWLFRPENMRKVCEGRYDPAPASSRGRREEDIYCTVTEPDDLSDLF